MPSRIRYPVRKRLLDIAEAAYTAAGSKITVSPTWDWTRPGQTTLFLGTGPGETTPESIGSTNTLAEDAWTISGSLWVFGQRDGLAAEREASRLLATYEDALRSDARLYRQDPEWEAVDDGHPDFRGLTSAAISNVTGPWHSAEVGGEPLTGRATFEITCTSTFHT